MSEDGRKTIKKWRSDYGEGSARMQALVEEMNSALAPQTKVGKR